MIIGVSGKIGSGKDLIGQIIQYLTKKDSNMDDQDFIEELAGNEFFGDAVSDWQIRKFADKLKDIVCLLIGCTRQQLEDRNFKNQELGEEWWYWKVYSNIAKNHCELISYNGEHGFYDRKSNYQGHALIQLTPRLLLQLLGTQCGRQIIHPNIWVNALFTDYKSIFYNPHDKSSFKPEHLGYPNWIITDTRFPNEADAIKRYGGIVIRVERAMIDRFPELYEEFLSNSIASSDNIFIQWLCESSNINYQELGQSLKHESETALDDFDNFDYIIENDGDIQGLIEKVRAILRQEKIII